MEVVMVTRRIVAVSKKMQLVGEAAESKHRTATFDETATLKEVFDWLRYKSSDGISEIYTGSRWWDAELSLHEDENTKEPGPFDASGFANDPSGKEPF
jgi:hypothetical protein